MELASPILSSTAVIGVAVARSHYAWVPPGAICFLSLFPVGLYRYLCFGPS
jgi:hypothetical protein